jgi:hypothetical protein
MNSTNGRTPNSELTNAPKWQVIFVSAEERYGLAVAINNTLQLACRNMVEPVARRIAETLNTRDVDLSREAKYSRET